MPYPETAEGFMINDQKDWTNFEKKEVCDATWRGDEKQTADNLSSSS